VWGGGDGGECVRVCGGVGVGLAVVTMLVRCGVCVWVYMETCKITS